MVSEEVAWGQRAGGSDTENHANGDMEGSAGWNHFWHVTRGIGRRPVLGQSEQGDSHRRGGSREQSGAELWVAAVPLGRPQV